MAELSITLSVVVVHRWFMAVTKSVAGYKLQLKNGTRFQHPEGAFLVRPSEQNPDDLSMSVR